MRGCAGKSSAWLALVVLLAGCRALTYVTVAVEIGDVQVPAEVAAVRIHASLADTPDGGGYASQEVRLCPPGANSGCAPAPVTVVLTPSALRPDAEVRVQVDALDRDGAIFSSDASRFAFTPGRAERLTFYLTSSCRGSRCASDDRACAALGGCVRVAPAATPPDLAPVRAPVQPIERRAIHLIPVPSRTDAPRPVPIPTGLAPGDLVLLLTRTPPARATDWTTLGTTAVGALYTRRAADDESVRADTYALAPASSGDGIILAIYRGVGEVIPLNATLLGPSPTLPSVEIARAGSLLVSFVGLFLTQYQCQGAAFSWSGLELFERLVPTAGPIGARPLSCAVQPTAAFELALAPVTP